MGLIVQKFGGDALGDKGKGKKRNGDDPLFGAEFLADKFTHIAKIVKRTRDEGHQVVVVVSAMGKTTDDLVTMAARISERPPERELDILLTSDRKSVV